MPVLLTEKKTEAILCGHPGSFATYRKELTISQNTGEEEVAFYE